MQHATTEQIKKAARRFYKAGKLTAQHPVKEKRNCVYLQGRTYRCAIGAAMNDTTVALVRKGGLGLAGTVDAIDGIAMTFEDNTAATNIQEAHDNWCDYASDNLEDAEEKKLAFTDLIGIKRKAV